MRDARPLDRAALRAGAAAGVEILIAVGLATAGVAALQSTTSDDAGLGSLYLLAVLLIAIRRGQLAALVTAVLGVLALNFFFIAPAPPAGDRPLPGPDRADRAADRGRRRRPAGRASPASAPPRPRAARCVAAAREREAKLVAEVASAILVGRERRRAARDDRQPRRARDRRGARPDRARAGADARCRTRSRCRCTRAPATRGCT